MVIKRPLYIRVLQFVPAVLLVLAVSFSVVLNNPSVSSASPWETDGWDKISSGDSSTCGLSAGRLYCWGILNGVSSQVPRLVDPFGVLNGKSITDVSVGLGHVCVVATGKAYCWGNNGNGQLGNGTTNDSSVPVAVDTSGVLSGKTVTRVVAANVWTCAIADAQAYCWGDNQQGALGDGTTTESHVPVSVDTSGVLSGKTVTDISAKYSLTCVLADGNPYCWGALTGGNPAISQVPVAVDTSGVLSGKTITAIDAGGIFSACVIADGKVYCWGNTTGDGTWTQRQSPVAVDTSGVLNGKTITNVSTGNGGACAADSNGQAYCWGKDDLGQLGDGTNTDSPSPVAVDMTGVLSGKVVTSVSYSGNHVCAIASTNGFCWGLGASGELGNQTTLSTNVPSALVSAQPTISGTDPIKSGTPGGGLMNIYGNNFDNPTVTIGGNPATVTFSVPTLIVVTIPPSTTPGLVDITVTNADTTSVTQSNAFEYVSLKVLPNQFKGIFGTSGTGNGQFDWPENITTDSDGNFYVTDNGNSRIEVFDKNGVYVRQFGAQGTGNGQFNYPTAVKIGSDGNVYVLDTSNQRVQVFNKQGTFIRQMDVSASGYAEGMALNSKGDIYITDCDTESKVKIYKSDGTFLRTLGTDGSGDGQFNCSYAVAVDSNDDVYISDSSNYRIQVFDKDDNFIRKFGSQGIGEGQFGWVEDLILDANGNVLAVDSQNNRVQVFTKEGTYLGQIGSFGAGDGQFSWPSSIAIGKNGDLYITDAGNHHDRVEIFEGMPQASMPSVTTPTSQPTTKIPAPTNSGKRVIADDVGTDKPTDKAEIEKSIAIDGGTPITGDPVIPKRPTFSGIVAPFAEVVVTIHSDPVICKTTADAEGKWSCTLDRDLPAGTHHVTIELTNQDGTKTTLGPYTVEVKGGDTVDSSQVADKNTSKAVKNENSSLVPVYLGVATVLLFVLIVTLLLIQKRVRKAA